METQTPPPTVEEELQRVLDEFSSRRRFPTCIPQPREAVPAWWIALQEPARETERPYRSATPGSEGSRWICPYHNRLVYTLRKFLFLLEKEQRFILAAREKGIFWRGDDMPFFARVIAETERMKNMGVDVYRDDSISKMKIYLRDRSFPSEQNQEARAEREAIQTE